VERALELPADQRREPARLGGAFLDPVLRRHVLVDEARRGVAEAPRRRRTEAGGATVSIETVLASSRLR